MPNAVSTHTRMEDAAQDHVDLHAYQRVGPDAGGQPVVHLQDLVDRDAVGEAAHADARRDTRRAHRTDTTALHRAAAGGLRFGAHAPLIHVAIPARWMERREQAGRWHRDRREVRRHVVPRHALPHRARAMWARHGAHARAATARIARSGRRAAIGSAFMQAPAACRTLQPRVHAR